MAKFTHAALEETLWILARARSIARKEGKDQVCLTLAWLQRRVANEWRKAPKPGRKAKAEG